MKEIWYIDAHTHTNDSDLINEFNEITKLCYENKILFGIASYDLESSMVAIKQAEKYKYCYALVGIHPHNISTDEDYEFYMNEIDKLLSNDLVLGHSETGLDYSRPELLNKENQIKWFIGQLLLSKKHKKPAMIHVRDAYDDTIEIIKKYWDKNIPLILHCYSGNIDITKKFLDLDMNIYFSFSGVITFKNASELREVVKIIPNNKILSETDAPYLAPTPFRGKKNYPYYIFNTVQMIAELKNINLEETKKMIFNNHQTIFKMNWDY